MVVVPKSDGNVRICVDLTKLNQSIRRERHPLPAVDQVPAQLAGATVLSKLNANSGFWQIPLSPDSAKLTTFITLPLVDIVSTAYHSESLPLLNIFKEEFLKF